jgi:histidyl-tRNA synthetase
MTESRIEPRTLKGFRDYPPDLMIPREWIIDTARRVYRSFGFAPIDTPALEYAEVLLGKGGGETEKQVYRFKDHGDRDVALRFDLTIPFARFAAANIGKLGKPFKRYHVGPVWRGENTQAGRYREFIQCDFDVIGTESMVADVETLLVMHETMLALGIEKFTIRINNRKVLNGLLAALGIEAHSTAVLRAIDKLDKVGADAVREEITRSTGVDAAKASHVLDFCALEGDAGDVLGALAGLVRGSEGGARGVAELRTALDGLAAAGADLARFAIDPTIARGLDYYTGTVFETRLDELPGIGSVASGGRYDDLASLYTKEKLPGIGGSLGVDRLLAALEELGRLDRTATPAPILVTLFGEDTSHAMLALAARLRRSGLGVELYPEAKKLGKQLEYANRRGHRLAIIQGPDEAARGVAQVKDLKSGLASDVAVEGLADHCRNLFAAGTPPA